MWVLGARNQSQSSARAPSDIKHRAISSGLQDLFCLFLRKTTWKWNFLVKKMNSLYDSLAAGQTLRCQPLLVFWGKVSQVHCCWGGWAVSSRFCSKYGEHTTAGDWEDGRSQRHLLLLPGRWAHIWFHCYAACSHTPKPHM